VEDIEALRENFQVDKIAIAGHSHGGFIALKYAIKYPASKPINKRAKKNVHQTPTKMEAEQKRRNPNPNSRIEPQQPNTHRINTPRQVNHETRGGCHLPAG
jgi:uncharacterized alpha/beta hydrolase family protein